MCVCVFFDVSTEHPWPGQDGSLDLESRYGCTQPERPEFDDDLSSNYTPMSCGVDYGLSADYGDKKTIAGAKIGE